MLNLLRKFLKPTLRGQLEDGMREAMRKYADRNTAPSLRVYVSTDLVPQGVDERTWAADENEHLRRFALQWAEDNNVPRAGLRVEVILLDTKREFAFVKPVGALATSVPGGEPMRSQEQPAPIVSRSSGGLAVLEVVNAPNPTDPIEVNGEITIGRKSDGQGVVGTGDRYMSARHARLHVSGGTLHVTDLDSKNRTFVNGDAIPPHQPVALRPGDEIRLGTTTFRLARVS